MVSLLGRPLTFGDDAQIEELRRLALEKAQTIVKVHNRDTCDECDGTGYSEEIFFKCRNCYNRSEWFENAFKEVSGVYSCVRCEWIIEALRPVLNKVTKVV